MPQPALASASPSPRDDSDAAQSGLSLSEVRTLHFGPYDLHIAPGECVSLQGESGSGKTLLLRAIADLDPHQGTVCLDGKPSSQFYAPTWRCQVGLLSAESLWWFDSVGEHFGDQPCPYLEALGFDDDTLSWPVSRLSSGQKQRLALARLLMNQPRVLLLDEPTSSLDAKTTEAVESMVSRYRQQQSAAVLWVSHDTAQAQRVASRHFRLQDGQLAQTQLPEPGR